MNKVQSRSRFRVQKSAESFLLLSENRLAYTAVDRLKNAKSGSSSSLVYIYGPSGIGKSHLVRHFLHEVGRSHPSLRTLHLTASEFAARFAQACESDTISEFQQTHSELDILVCEDLQSLERRTETQRQLVNCLDQVLKSGGRALLTCHKLPGDLSHVTSRLVNRCHGGVCTPIHPLGVASRVQLISHFSRTRQIPVRSDTAQLLAKNLNVSPRELLATIVQLDTTARLAGTDITPQFIRRYLDGEVKTLPVKISQIARAVSRHFGVTLSKIRSSTRLQGLVIPRQCAMFLARELTDESLGKIADYFGRRNHSTVVHACNRIRKILPEQPTLRQHLNQIQRELAVTINNDGR